MNNFKKVFSSHPYFKDLSERHWEFLFSCAQEISFQANQYIFRETEEAKYFYMIEEGRVALELHPLPHDPLTLQTLNMGEVLGWSWLIPPHFWRFDARAMTDLKLWVFDGVKIREYCKNDHEFGYIFLRELATSLSQRLEAARLQVLDMYSPRRSQFL